MGILDDLTILQEMSRALKILDFKVLYFRSRTQVCSLAFYYIARLFTLPLLHLS